MAVMVRRAAKKAIFNAKDGHGLLGLLIFDEKLVYENFRKLVESKENASLSLLKWTREEDNLALQDVFSKVFEVGSIWTAIMKQFSDDHLKYRKAFKDVLCEERELDELRKRELAYTTRLNKLQKQLEQNKRNNSASKPTKAFFEEMTEVLSKTEEAHAELEVEVTKHEIFKAKKLRGALHFIAESLQTLAEQTLTVSRSYKQLADLIPDTPTQLSEEKVFKGAGIARRVVTELSKEVGYDPVQANPLGKNNQTYIYAISPPQQDSCERTRNASISLSAIGENKHRRSPPAVPRHRNISESSQRFSQQQSLEDLRPPPSCPPPPLPSPEHTSSRPTPVTRTNVKVNVGIQGQHFGKPQSLNDLRLQAAPRLRKVSSPAFPSSQDKGNKWYARSRAMEGSDSEDSDGYTEPCEQYNKRPTTQILSDGIINHYAGSRDHSPWQQESGCQALVSEFSEIQEDASDSSEPPYVEFLSNAT